MARVYGITLPAGVDVVFNKTLKMYDVAVHCNIGKNRRFLTRQMKLNLRDFTKLFQVANLWHTFTTEEKDAWHAAGDAQGGAGYNLFTQDQIYRLMNGISFSATPSIYHQYFVGHVQIGGAATSCRLRQYYNVPWQLPATLNFNYHSDLMAAGPSPSVVLRWFSTAYYSGKNVTTDQDTALDLSTVWKNVEVNKLEQVGTRANWGLELRFNDVQGDFWFDDIFVEWDGELQNRDPFADNVQDNWTTPDFPEDCILESVYPLGDAL